MEERGRDFPGPGLLQDMVTENSSPEERLADDGDGPVQMDVSIESETTERQNLEPKPAIINNDFVEPSRYDPNEPGYSYPSPRERDLEMNVIALENRQLQLEVEKTKIKCEIDKLRLKRMYKKNELELRTQLEQVYSLTNERLENITSDMDLVEDTVQQDSEIPNEELSIPLVGENDLRFQSEQVGDDLTVNRSISHLHHCEEIKRLAISTEDAGLVDETFRTDEELHDGSPFGENEKDLNSSNACIYPGINQSDFDMNESMAIIPDEYISQSAYAIVGNNVMLTSTPVLLTSRPTDLLISGHLNSGLKFSLRMPGNVKVDLTHSYDHVYRTTQECKDALIASRNLGALDAFKSNGFVVAIHCHEPNKLNIYPFIRKDFANVDVEGWTFYYLCNVCLKRGELRRYQAPKDLANHVEQHSPVHIVCPICKCTFGSRSALNYHTSKLKKAGRCPSAHTKKYVRIDKSNWGGVEILDDTLESVDSLLQALRSQRKPTAMEGLNCGFSTRAKSK